MITQSQAVGIASDHLSNIGIAINEPIGVNMCTLPDFTGITTTHTHARWWMVSFSLSFDEGAYETPSEVIVYVHMTSGKIVFG